VVALRTRELRRRQRILEAAVARRTNELLATKDVLQQASSAKTEFISTVSHELRNPLTGARMMADVLLAGPLDAPIRTRVLRLHGCLKYLQQMLDEILDLSRIELGHVRYRLSRFRLGQLVEDTVAMFEAIATEKGLAYRTDLGRWENSWYRAEATHLQRVLINYLSNAVKFTPRGAITFTVTAATAGPAGFETLRFTVTDTGAGVAPVLQERIFRAFVRHHDPEHQGDAPGNGLGLALSRKLADLSGGKVGFTSSPGVGAAFWVEWPLLPAAADPDEALAEERDFSPLRVLVVEDDPIQLEATVLLLQELGVVATTAPSVDAAERQLHAQPFNVVLADYNLGGATGMDLIARCQTLPNFDATSTRFHLVTAHSSEAVRSSAHAAGFHGFHGKPISLTELHAILTAALLP
jgi:CheY-like chemotaxis protein